jgi:flagellar motor switch protein FliG
LGVDPQLSNHGVFVMADAKTDSAKNQIKKKIPGMMKAVSVLMLLGEEAAKVILANLSEVEIFKIVENSRKMAAMTQEDLMAVMEEFCFRFEGVEGNAYLYESEMILRNIAEEILGKDKVRKLFTDRVKGYSPFKTCENASPELIASILNKEHPQTIALVLSILPVAKSAAILMELPENIRNNIVERVANISSIPKELINDIGDTLAAEILSRGESSQGKMKVDGVDVAKSLIMEVDGATKDTIFAALTQNAPDLADKIRKSMFLFDDFANMDDRSLQIILKEVDSSIFTKAMKTASEEIKIKIKRNISKRAAEMLDEDLAALGPMRVSEVELAQKEIVTVALRLADEGKIELNLGGDDDVMV